jgi:Family of unknown function (DUF6515)
MKISFSTPFSLAICALALTMLGLPQSTTAQRFNHGGAEPAARPTMPAPRPSAPPAPRPEPSRPVAQAPRVETRNFAPPPRQAAPAPEARPSINGGSRNFGNHDFGRANTAAAAPIVNTTPINRDVRANRGNNTGRVNVNIHERANVYHTGDYNGLHPYSYHPYNPYYWGPRWHPIGAFLAALAATAVRVSFNNQFYYYDDGCYYIPSSGGGYSVVPPPIGAIVSDLPEGYETTMVGNDEYYYYGGAFYILTDQGYQVVAAPVGAVVTELPVGAVNQQINGEDLLVYNNVYYQPISQDGQDAYEVVQVN